MSNVCIVKSQQRHDPSCPYASYINSASCPGFLISSTSSPWTLPVCATMIHESGSGFWEKTLALPEDRCFPSVRRTKELILHIATSSQLLDNLFLVFKMIWFKPENPKVFLLFCRILIAASLPAIPQCRSHNLMMKQAKWVSTSLCRMLADSSQTPVCIYSFYPLAGDASTYIIQNLTL